VLKRGLKQTQAWRDLTLIFKAKIFAKFFQRTLNYEWCLSFIIKGRHISQITEEFTLAVATAITWLQQNHHPVPTNVAVSYVHFFENVVLPLSITTN
jgi:hypothetical protein